MGVPDLNRILPQTSSGSVGSGGDLGGRGRRVESMAALLSIASVLTTQAYQAGGNAAVDSVMLLFQQKQHTRLVQRTMPAVQESYCASRTVRSRGVGMTFLVPLEGQEGSRAHGDSHKYGDRRLEPR